MLNNFYKNKKASRNKVAIVIFIGLFFVILISMTHNIIINKHTKDLQLKAHEQIAVHKKALSNALKRLDFLPFVIVRDKKLLDWALKQPTKANIALQNIKQASNANELYIMNNDGLTLASSNWRSKFSFVGKNYGYRPYFKQALSGVKGQFYGIGATTKKPGYFISLGASNNKNKVVVVAVAKIDLSVIEKSWSESSENIFVANKDGVVILSSENDWRYKTLQKLTKLQLKIIEEQKQFATESLNLLSSNIKTNNKQLTIKNTDYLYQEAKIKEFDWSLYYLVATEKLDKLVINTWIKIGLIISILLAILLIVKVIKSRNELKISRKESNEFKRLNKLLNIEIFQRKKVEKELEYKNKLAVMGELSTSIVHELSQPLSAMKSYIASANLTNKDSNEESLLVKLEMLVDRMNKIARQLKFFSMSNKKDIKAIDICDALNAALMISAPTIEKYNVNLIKKGVNKPYIVIASQVCIEQVFVNLINNACIAMQDTDIKNIDINFKAKDDKLIITIKDTGCGLEQENLKMLFEPFYTTKIEGVGLGLTISKNIIIEFGGTLIVHNNENYGACFTITLPLYK